MIRGLCLVIAVVAVSSGALAQSNQFRPRANMENTDEDRACRGDAHRFCKEDIPDQMRVASCLQEHRERLTKACRTVLAAHGM